VAVITVKERLTVSKFSKSNIRVCTVNKLTFPWNSTVRL